MKKPVKPSYVDFDIKKYEWKADIDYRAQPELYKVGRGEQGVLIVEPYKSEIVPHWRFKTPDIATDSAKIIYKMFLSYLKAEEFVGADIARKFLQMGFTRARRYANYKGGRKYSKDGDDYSLNEKGTDDPLKAESAQIFYDAWQKAERNRSYAKMKRDWQQQYG